MEPLEIFDSINNKHINIYVTTEVAEKCRTDNIFAQDLFNKLQDQNIEEGSAVEIETIKTEIDDVYEEPTLEERIDKETWSRRETLKLLQVYQKYKKKFNEFRQRKHVWTLIAKELSTLNVHKSPEKCAEKWKNLLRTYKSANEKPLVPTRFQFYQEMNGIFNNTQMTLSDSDSDDLGEKHLRVPTERSTSPLDLGLRDEPMEKEFWSRYETLKLLKAFQKHKELRKSFVKEKQFWMVISAELAKDNIQKPIDKCATKWKNLFRSYKRNVDKPTLPSRFQYFQEVSDVMNGVELFIPDNIINISDDVDFEKILDPDQFKCFLEESDFDCPKDVCSWTADETSKLIKAYKKHKHRFKKCPTRKYVWAIIAAELTRDGVQKDTEKCENKWKSLMRSYKRGSKSTESPRFYFFDEMCEALKDDDSLNDGEVSTTQNELLSAYDKDSLENTNSLDNIDILENEDNDETENTNYEEIIIETESDKLDETDDNKFWSFNETSGLLQVYAVHRNKFKEAKKKLQIWEEISQELESLNIYKSAESCEKKWKSMFSVYKTHKLNKTGPGKFSFYKEIDNMLKEKTEVIDSDENIVHNKKCKCMEKRMLEKQTRHIERMQLLKRKLDLEERKVEAFEFYVKHLKNSSS